MLWVKSDFMDSLIELLMKMYAVKSILFIRKLATFPMQQELEIVSVGAVAR